MANAKAKLFYTKQKYLDSLPKKNGNIIFVPDSNTVCLDMSNQRYTYQTIKIFNADSERLSEQSPHDGFYFVEETNVIWRWANNRWNQISPTNLEPVVYGASEDEFPSLGKNNTLYYTDEGIFNWKEVEQQYNLIANANRWDNIQ